jgi:polysaccharide pyruvyl transferase WcaK-like protein
MTKRAAIASGTDEKIYRVYHNPSKFLDLIKQVTVFVGMKLHSVILATCAFVPSIMVEYQTKCRDYMMAVDQQQFCVRPDALNASQLWEKICFLGERRREFSDNLFRKVQHLNT